MPPPGSVAGQKRAREAAAKAKRSLIAELNLSEGIDPRISEAIFSQVAAPKYTVAVPGQYRGKRAATKKETESFFREGYQAELAKIGQPQIAEAVAAGADPRTIEALTSKLVSAYTNPQMKRTRTITKAKREAAIAEQTRPTKEKLASEAKIQPTLKEIRRLRQDVAQRGASLLRRNTGSRALLSSPTGGSGFFGGYFKG